ncbi:DUF4079 domain-containing protein [Planktothrix sp. FACHB-1365]|uniref:DUF4079 domain-containing protein n=1 Tax=Planktothrix sp. FACHB-1365 TaxID=2692855 RepID=UPI001683C8AB|nr:DUF4079 domain-containing protein [Planktothrix sp. FACHB-1365]MBD2484673.1 DUF4079 domain-containing protein [Planktothrix sp. FACHB-1365]
MNLPSFLWLWKIAAWSMGCSVFAYFVLAMTGGWMLYSRQSKQPRPKKLRTLHYFVGGGMVCLVLALLAIGLVGTLGYYGSLGHSIHLAAGLIVVSLVLGSAWSATQINPKNPWARSLHISLNIGLFFAFTAVSLSGWVIVQKYLP